MVGRETFTIDTSRNVMNPAMHKNARISPGRLVARGSGDLIPAGWRAVDSEVDI
jgi:hypothetical protein